MESAVWRKDFALKMCVVSLIKWFSTVQQFFEKIVKCLGPLDQSDKCCQLGENTAFEWIFKKSQHLLRQLLMIFRTNVWFSFASLFFLNVSLSFTRIVPPCVTAQTAVQELRCKNQASVILFCWHTQILTALLPQWQSVCFLFCFFSLLLYCCHHSEELIKASE